MKKASAILLMVAALSACQQSEPTYDVQHYLDNPDERTAKLAECENNPGEKGLSPNCVNAKKAQHKARFQGEGMPKIR